MDLKLILFSFYLAGAMSLPEIIGNKFLYFGYGSNMLSKRILLNNRSAVRKDFGKLKGYKLDFFNYSSRWQGSPATIVPSSDKHVMGAVWELNLENMADLDKQESVNTGMYIPLSLPIELSDGTNITCRAYQLRELPEELPTGNPVPPDRIPSKTYLKVIVKGAIESKIPDDYIEFLKSFKNNGVTVDEFEESLDVKSFEL